MKTPDTHKIELSGERFVAGTHKGSQRWRGRKRPTKVGVDEPLMVMIDGVMAKEGVSDRRLEEALGLYKRKLKNMRQDEGQWRLLKLARQMLWAMGYDLEMRIVKRKTPDKCLVMTNSEIEGKKKRGVSDWDRQSMWSRLGVEKLSNDT